MGSQKSSGARTGCQRRPRTAPSIVLWQPAFAKPSAGKQPRRFRIAFIRFDLRPSVTEPSRSASGEPSAVRPSSYSAAGGRGYTGCPSSGNTGPNLVEKRVRCSRGRSPRIVGSYFRQFSLTASHFHSPHPARRSRAAKSAVNSKAFRTCFVRLGYHLRWGRRTPAIRRAGFIRVDSCPSVVEPSQSASGEPSAVRPSSYSAAVGRGYTGCPPPGNTGPNLVEKRVRCSRGRSPRIVGNYFRQFSLVPSRFPSSRPARRGRAGPQRGWFAFITSAIETGAPPRRLLSSAASMKAMISTVSSGVTGATRVWKNFTTSFSSGL
jgi:hypothetical protein